MKLESERVENVAKYLISFLVRNTECETHVKYLCENDVLRESERSKGNVYIIRSDFFGKNYGEGASLPAIPLKEFDGNKIFYGRPETRNINENIVIYADLIASAYFVVTKYEELLNSTRNEYGNFPAADSILVKEGIINKPIVDYYGRTIRNCLRKLGYTIPEKEGFSKLYFTHDIDHPFSEYSFICMVKTIGRSLLVDKRFIIHPLVNYIGYYGVNPRRTWDYMLQREQEIKEESGVETESICFIVATETKDEYTQAYIRDKKIKPMLGEMLRLGAVLGMHTSFSGAADGEIVKHERQVLRETTEGEILYHRNHYLRQMHPCDFEFYEKAGFTDDFTTGFNELIGFRLGTCHPIKWIDPRDGRISELTLHGLEIMDGSVIGNKPYQMQLSYEEAKEACKGIIDEIYVNNGEFDFLCHNGMFEKKPGNYIKELYDWILDYVLEKAEDEKLVQ